MSPWRRSAPPEIGIRGEFGTVELSFSRKFFGTPVSKLIRMGDDRSGVWNPEFVEVSMSSPGSLTQCIYNLQSPDHRLRDEAARVIWDRFAGRLQALVRRHLDNRVRRREDEHDVLQSMYASFCIGQMAGKATPASRDELWKLLVRIALCKLVNTAQRHTAARRDVRRERAKPTDDHEGFAFPRWMLEHVDQSRPSPDEQFLVIDELERLLGVLSDEHRQIVLWKVDGFKNAEIANMIGRTVRSVELKLQIIRKRLEDCFFGALPPAKGARDSSRREPTSATAEAIKQDPGGDRDIQ
jgi:RNA polymerase sigma-70 factor (ECF subfamily)